MTIEDIKRAVLARLGRKPSPRTLDATASELEAEAQQLRRQAEIQREQQRRPADQRVTPRKPTAGPGANPGRGVRWNGRQLIIGRELWYGIGSPMRVSFHFDGGATEIRAGDEYAVIVKAGQAPRVSCRGAWDIGAWGEGWRIGEVAGRAIRFRPEATED